jgi:N-acetylmuramoyl-L-alanine amidase
VLLDFYVWIDTHVCNEVRKVRVRAACLFVVIHTDDYPEDRRRKVGGVSVVWGSRKTAASSFTRKHVA